MTIYVRRVAEALARRGVATDIFTRAVGTEPRVVQLSPLVRVVCIDAGPRRAVSKHLLPAHLDEFAAGVRAWGTGQRLRYDAIHTHYWQSGVAGIELADRWSLPLVHSHHTLGRVKNGSLPPGEMPEPQSRLDGEAEVISAAAALIASTEEEAQQLVSLYGASPDRLKTVHPGVDHDLFSPGDRLRARALLDLDDDASLLLYVGRIQPLKGLDLAVASVEQLVSALDRPLIFVLVGGASGTTGGEELERVQRIARAAGIEENIRFVGPQPHRRLPVYYRAADAVIVSSHSESFGLAALEAHACGTPVVATAVGGLSYVVEDARSGFLVDTRDPAVFAARLKTLLADPDLLAASRVHAWRAARRFSWDRTAGSLLELYGCLLREELPEACSC